MKEYKLKHPMGIGDYFLRGKIVDIDLADDRRFILTLRYKTISDKRVIVYID